MPASGTSRPRPSCICTGNPNSGRHVRVADDISAEPSHRPISFRLAVSSGRRKRKARGGLHFCFLSLQELAWTIRPKSVAISSPLGSPWFPQSSLLSSREDADPDRHTFLGPRDVISPPPDSPPKPQVLPLKSHTGVSAKVDIKC